MQRGGILVLDRQQFFEMMLWQQGYDPLSQDGFFEAPCAGAKIGVRRATITTPIAELVGVESDKFRPDEVLHFAG